MEYLLIVWKEAESAEPTLTKSKLADSRKVVIRKDFAQYPMTGYCINVPPPYSAVPAHK